MIAIYSQDKFDRKAQFETAVDLRLGIRTCTSNSVFSARLFSNAYLFLLRCNVTFISVEFLLESVFPSNDIRTFSTLVFSKLHLFNLFSKIVGLCRVCLLLAARKVSLVLVSH